MGTSIVGVDIGGASLRAVEVSGAGGSKPTISRIAEVALPPDAVRRGEVVEPNTVAAVLKKLWSTGGFSSKNVVLGMGNQRVLARDLSMPKMPLKQIKESLPFQVQDMLPMPVVDAVLDFYPVSESVGEQGPVVNGILVAAVKEAVLANVNTVRLAGLKPVGVDLNPFAISRVIGRTEHGDGAIAVVDIGGATTSILVMTDGVPQFVRIVGSGGDDITRAVSTRMQFELPQAEQAKRAVGLTDQPIPEEQRPVLEAVYAAAGELVTNIRNTISFFDSTHEKHRVVRIVLVGNGARLVGLPKALADYTRVPVTYADPLGGIPLSGAAQKADPAGQHSLSLALGLALGAAA